MDNNLCSNTFCGTLREFRNRERAVRNIQKSSLFDCWILLILSDGWEYRCCNQVFLSAVLLLEVSHADLSALLIGLCSALFGKNH